MDQPKLFSAFLSGLYKHIFEKDQDITLEFLKEQIFANNEEVTIESLERMFNDCSQILNKAAYEDWELAHLEANLKQSQKFSENQQEVFIKFWRTQKPKIHEVLSKEVTWNNSLNKMSWRIDSQAKTKKQSEVNELTTIVELVLGNKNKEKKESQVIRFEMDKTQLDKALVQIKAIQKQLTKYSS